MRSFFELNTMQNHLLRVTLLSSLFIASGAACAQMVEPTFVTVAGSLQQSLGCTDNWQPSCEVTRLTLDAEDQVWQGTFDLPAGDWEYKVPLNGSWDENYGLNAGLNGANIPLKLTAADAVKFYFSRTTNWITDNRNSLIAVAAGSFQSELGCAQDWDPSCLRSWLQDADGDGFYRFKAALPAGDYQVKVAINESWQINYGAGGVANGDNIEFTVPADCNEIEFVFDAVSNILTIGPAQPAPQPQVVTIAGSLQEELGCSSDWQPDCTFTRLSFDAVDGIWQGSFNVPAGAWEYKAPLNGSWDENYGANATLNGPNIPLNLADARSVKFYYSRQTNWVADNVSSTIAVAAGSFQSEIGCPGDWDPSCLRSWLQDADGDGIYTAALRIPAGEYEVKVPHNESWDENYGEGGVPNGANIAFQVPLACGLTYFSYNATTHVLTVGATPGGIKGSLKQAKAMWLDQETIAWNGADIDSEVVLHTDADAGLRLDESGVTGGERIALTRDETGMSPALKAKFPHLVSYAVYKLPTDAIKNAAQFVRGQLAVSASNADGSPRDATGVQLPGVLDSIYRYDGSLGVSFERGKPSLRVWAPTAKNVALLMFDSADASESTRIPMTRDDATGVWSVAGDASWNQKYYLYDVEVFAPSTGKIERNQVTDPYSVSLSADSKRTQIIDLNDRRLMPQAWRFLPKPKLEAPEDIVLYELHVRDFSIDDASVPAIQRGTFAAFGQRQSDGMKHLRSLARAGVSHVHLLPAFDFATVPERRVDQKTVDAAALSKLPADSDQQQAALAAIKDQDGFNWGYDPFHFNAPEGSYSTDPNGPVRIKEFRDMVQSLNLNGLRVVMDVVYNHTSSAGQDAKSVLDRVVPGYYHRLNLEGGIENSTCCANTASEHAMMEKLLIDSVLIWAKQYKVDGFRFDLMGHHSKQNMLKLRAVLDNLTLAKDGVDGRSIYLYGEGWNFGEVANNARFEQATQRNMAGTGIGSFSDRLRDGIRGGNPFGDIREQGFITGLGTDSNDYEAGRDGDRLADLRHITDWVRIGLAGDLADYELENAQGDIVRADQIDYFGQRAGYTADPSENIKYIEAHDNETLFDVIQLKASTRASLSDRIRIQNLGNSVVLLGQGIPFIHAGQEFLRSKSLDRDSFNAGDWFNSIDWTFTTSNWGKGLPSGEKNGDKWPLMAPLLANPALASSQFDRQQTVRYFETLLRIRNSSPLFRLRNAQQIKTHLQMHNSGPSQLPGLVVMELDDADGKIDRRYPRIMSLINARPEAATFEFVAAKGTAMTLHPLLVGAADPLVKDASFAKATGTFNVPARTTAVFVEQRSAKDQLALLISDVQMLQQAGQLSSERAKLLTTLLRTANLQLQFGHARFAEVLLSTVDALINVYAKAKILDVEQAMMLSRYLGQARETINQS